MKIKINLLLNRIKSKNKNNKKTKIENKIKKQIDNEIIFHLCSCCYISLVHFSDKK